jgi:hypothetical protein
MVDAHSDTVGQVECVSEAVTQQEHCTGESSLTHLLTHSLIFALP